MESNVDYKALGPAERQRVEEIVRRAIEEMRIKPTAQKEDLLGLELATLPPAERDYVPVVLLRIVSEEARGG